MLAYLLMHTLRAAARLLFRLLGGYRIVCAHHVPRKGGVLICPNHVCDADPPAIGAAVPRYPYFMAKEELFSLRLIGPMMRALHAFPIRRDSADRSALRHAEQLLKAGEAVIIFPEGGGNFEGRLQPLQPGALLLALRTRVPVIPVALAHTNQVLPYGATRPRRSPHPVTVTFGEPLDLSDLYGKKGAVEEATYRLTVRLASMLNQPVPQGTHIPHDQRPPQRLPPAAPT